METRSLRHLQHTLYAKWLLVEVQTYASMELPRETKVESVFPGGPPLNAPGEQRVRTLTRSVEDAGVLVRQCTSSVQRSAT